LKEWIEIHGKEVLIAGAFIIAGAFLSVPFGRILSGAPNNKTKAKLIGVCTQAAEAIELKIGSVENATLLPLGRNASLHGSQKGFALTWENGLSDNIYCSAYYVQRQLRLENFRVNDVDKTELVKLEERE